MNKKLLLFALSVFGLCFDSAFMMESNPSDTFGANPLRFRDEFLNKNVTLPPGKTRKNLAYYPRAKHPVGASSPLKITFDENGNTVLHQAVDDYFFKDSSGRFSKRLKVPSTMGANFGLKNKLNMNGESPLFYAIRKYTAHPHLISFVTVLADRLQCHLDVEQILEFITQTKHKNILIICGSYELFLDFLLAHTQEDSLITRIQDELNDLDACAIDY